MVTLLNRHRRNLRDVLVTLFWRTGGMPSSHAALVASIAAATAFKQGITSDLFALSFWFALIVMRDAMGVRRATGLLSRALNALGRSTAEKMGQEFHPVKEIEGHTPLQVVVGALLGIFIAAALYWL
jgi:acid phosphatase family membrane protein YuiD